MGGGSSIGQDMVVVSMLSLEMEGREKLSRGGVLEGFESRVGGGVGMGLS